MQRGTLTARLDLAVQPELRSRLERLARQHGFKTSTLVRAVLLAWLDQTDEQGDGEEPALDVVLDLAAAENPSPSPAGGE